MMKKMLCLTQLLLLIIVGMTIDSCMQGGSGSTTTNGFTVSIQSEDGRSVANAVVRVRPNDYFASQTAQYNASIEQSIVDTVTGNDGVIFVTGLHPGGYTIEVQHSAENAGVLIHGSVLAGEQIDLGTWTVTPNGVISGSVDTSLFAGGKTFSVQVCGMERRIPINPVTGLYLIESLPPDTYDVRLVDNDNESVQIEYKRIILPSGDTVDVDPFKPWTHYGILSIDLTEAGIGVDDTILNVPLALKLNAKNFDFVAGKKKGGDLRITKTDGSTVYFDAEWYDSINSTASIWILLDTLCGNRSTHTLYLYSGNQQVGSVSNPAAVFDTAFGYGNVWHLNESGGTEQQDATVNRISAIPSPTMAGENDILGLLGRCQWFKSSDEYITVRNMQTPSEQTNNFTLVTWIKDSSTAASGIVTRADNRYALFHDNDNHWVFYSTTNGIATDSCFAKVASKEWTLLVGVVRGNNCYLYVNGSVADSCSIEATASPETDNSNSALFIGCYADTTAFFHGVLDEMRIHSRALSPLWIRFSYETQRVDQRAVSVTWIR